MALRDITNRPPKFCLHVDLKAEYATLRSGHHTGTVSHDYLRMQGLKSIDLWTNGNIYPLDPTTGTTPPFHNITQLMRFVGDGFNGLLGYCGRLHAAHLHALTRTQELQCSLTLLQASTKVDKERWSQRVNELNKEVAELKIGLEERVHKIDRVADDYLRLRHSTRNLRRRVDHFTHLPMGYNACRRKRKAIGSLAKNSGALKRRVKATRLWNPNDFCTLSCLCHGLLLCSHLLLCCKQGMCRGIVGHEHLRGVCADLHIAAHHR